MRIMGIEFQASNMNYIVVTRDGAGLTFLSANRLTLGDTRNRADLVAFQSALMAILNGAQPDRIAVKAKPEAGKMSAGAAALKMEGILLANSPCDVEFVSPQRVSKVTAVENNLHKYLQAAILTALAAA